MISEKEMSNTTTTHDVIQDDEHHAAISRIVAIALDHSEHSEYAFKWALDNVLRPSTDLVILLNVRPLASIPGPYGSAYVDFSNYIIKMEEENRTYSHELLKKFAIQLKSLNFACKAFSLRGDPRDELTRKVEEMHCDLMVIGSRGLGAFKRMFIGSVSDHLVHHCHCPVVMVKSPESEKQTPANQNTVSPPSPVVPAAIK